MTTLTVRIPDELNLMLSNISTKQERSRSWIVKKALQSYLEDLDDANIAAKALEEYQEGNGKTYTIEEVAEELDISLTKHS